MALDLPERIIEPAVEGEDALDDAQQVQGLAQPAATLPFGGGFFRRRFRAAQFSENQRGQALIARLVSLEDLHRAVGAFGTELRGVGLAQRADPERASVAARGFQWPG